MIVVTHGISFAREVSNRVFFLHGCRIEGSADPRELFPNARSARYPPLA
jgi:ABC-type histidine transport system ATPase subunit